MPITIKNIRNTRYIYFVYHDKNEGKQKHVCCGADSNPEAKRKAIRLEIELLEKQSLEIDKKKKGLREALLKLA